MVFPGVFWAHLVGVNVEVQVHGEHGWVDFVRGGGTEGHRWCLLVRSSELLSILVFSHGFLQFESIMFTLANGNVQAAKSRPPIPGRRPSCFWDPWTLGQAIPGDTREPPGGNTPSEVPFVGSPWFTLFTLQQLGVVEALSPCRETDPYQS